MNITQEFRKVFEGEQAASAEEQEALLDVMLFMRDDNELGLCSDVIQAWALKISGVIEFMEATGKISSSQEEDLRMMVNRIESGRD